MKEALRSNDFSAGVKEVLYHCDISLSGSDDYVKKRTVCPFSIFLRHIYVEVMNTAVTNLGHSVPTVLYSSNNFLSCQ
jgi:hypothetical protein